MFKHTIDLVYIIAAAWKVSDQRTSYLFNLNAKESLNFALIACAI